MFKDIRKLARESLSYQRSMEVNGKRINVPIIAGQGGANLTEYEPFVEAFFSGLFQNVPGSFIDVGANIGQTLIKVKTYDRLRKYYGFETSPFCCYYVDRLIDANGFEDAVLIPVGLSSSARLVSFFYSEAGDPQGTVVENFWTSKHRKANMRSLLVQPGDAILEALGVADVGIIKIDVEGGELEVIEGLRGTLSRQQPMVVCEVLPYVPEEGFSDEASRESIRQRRDRAERLVELIKAIDYVCYRICPDGTLEETWNFGMQQYDDRLSNYFFCPRAKLQTVEKITNSYAEALARPHRH